MRIALVSPYSWTYPGGVTRHIEALADQFIASGHDVRVLAPYDPDDDRSARLHRGARPQSRPQPDYLCSLGRTIGFPANGAVSNIAITTDCVQTLRRELRHGGYDVVHLHEPVTPSVGWDALCTTDRPLVGTFHCYSTNPLSNGFATLIGARRRLNRLHVRIAVSEAAAWTGARFYGGHYRVIPNGVELGEPPALDRASAPTADRPLRLVFVGAAVERKGLGVLLRAFEAVREHLPVTLTIVGATQAEVDPLLVESRGVTVLGKVADAVKADCIRRADLLVAPSLGGESFGMVLTEAFAAGTPVIASDIPGYRDVVHDGIDGLLVGRGDAAGLARSLRDLALDPARRDAMALAAAEAAPRYAWDRVSAEVLNAYEDAITAPAPIGAVARSATRLGAIPADGKPRQPARRRLPSLERARPTRAARAVNGARRLGLATLVVGGLIVAGLALRRIGVHQIITTLLTSSPDWVLLSLGLMGLSSVLRAVAWHAILRAALPRSTVRLRDALQGTFIGVLMSATLPARLGEPSRSLIVARRLGRPRETLPAVLGTMVAQTLINLLALGILGVCVFSSINLFDGHHGALVVAAIAPAAVLVAVVLTPIVLRGGAPSGSAWAQAVVARVRLELTRVRGGLRVFTSPRLAATALAGQLSAWALQWLSCYALLQALGLSSRAGLGAAAAVLFVVNVTAVLPAAPSNVGVFQAACVAVLSGAYHVGSADALAYGIILQAVEIATALVIGMPALVKEGLSWKDVRMRALQAGPVQLAPSEPAPRDAEAQAPA
ncbi:MAG TPA: lysylphosphatidylglycerol synthase domain-containing protein [Solirubrobacteraceae bacterium]|jgi:phosphatidylinositol alpha-mannosyltransferase|nr:lysylphosphatidylglycerol synthase domain-containing protein [Solirubrobacteraceae bacterium]